MRGGRHAAASARWAPTIPAVGSPSRSPSRHSRSSRPSLRSATALRTTIAGSSSRTGTSTRSSARGTSSPRPTGRTSGAPRSTVRSRSSSSVQWVVGDGAPPVFPLVIVALYVAASVFVLWLALLCLPRGAAWVAAALFAVHPVHVEAVGNGVGQAELWTALVMVGATALYVRDRRQGLPRRRPPPPPPPAPRRAVHPRPPDQGERDRPPRAPRGRGVAARGRPAAGARARH